jgi:putative nucleotidyltransferase with HDIG domain
VRWIDSIPTIPTIILPLLEMLAAPIEDVAIHSIEQLVATDPSIAAQCLKMANSPLYGVRRIESIGGALGILGLRRVQSILLTCSLNKVVSRGRWGVDPDAFWRHSLGCALVTRKMAELIAYQDLEQAYLAGLLHDLGMIVSSIVCADEFRGALQQAATRRVALNVTEQEEMGFTHCESGAILARQWRLTHEVTDVIEAHHLLDPQRPLSPLVCIVHVSDLLCRLRDLGYGYDESLNVDFTVEPSWAFLTKNYPTLDAIDLARFTFDTDEWMQEVHHVVNSVFSPGVGVH